MCCAHSYAATILAYGQTGSGKTFTMSGSSGAGMLKHLIGVMKLLVLASVTTVCAKKTLAASVDRR